MIMLDPTRVSFVPSHALYPFEARWWESSVGRVHYIDEGQGETLLFLHGNPTWSFLFRNIILPLRDRYRCVALDMPGFGMSDRPAAPLFSYTTAEQAQLVRDFIIAQDLRDITIIGHDWGGPVGLWCTLAERDRVSRLVMSNTWYWPIENRINVMFSRVMSSIPIQWLLTEQGIGISQLLNATTVKPLESDVMAHYTDVFPSSAARQGLAVYPREMLNATAFLTELEQRVVTELHEIPILQIWGMRDPLLTPAIAARFRRPFHEATFFALPESRHLTPEEDPKRFVKALLRWLEPPEVEEEFDKTWIR
jgi:haloalkane dehalogenase